MKRTYQRGAKKRLPQERKAAESEATRNCQRLKLWLIQPEISEHKLGLATAEQVTSVGCVGTTTIILRKRSYDRNHFCKFYSRKL